MLIINDPRIDSCIAFVIGMAYPGFLPNNTIIYSIKSNTGTHKIKSGYPVFYEFDENTKQTKNKQMGYCRYFRYLHTALLLITTQPGSLDWRPFCAPYANGDNNYWYMLKHIHNNCMNVFFFGFSFLAEYHSYNWFQPSKLHLKWQSIGQRLEC